MDRQLKGLDSTGNRPPSCAVKKLGDAGMRPVGCAKDRRDLGIEVALITLVNIQCGDHHTFTVAECYRVTRRQTVSEFVRNVENHRNRPESSVGETHLRANRSMVRGTEVAVEGRVGAVDQEFEIAELTWAEVDRAPISGLFADLGGTFLTDHEVYQT